MGLFEPHHLIIILIIALVIFGPGKIGDLGGSLGRAVRDFKKGIHEDPAPQAAAAPRQPESVAQASQPAAVSVGTEAKETA